MDSPDLVTNYGTRTIGMTDNIQKMVFLADILEGDLLYNVLCHELCHVYCFSYGIYMDEEDEERLAQFISDYGRAIISDTGCLINALIHAR